MKTLITKIMIALTLVAMLLGMSSCYTERTAQKQVDKAHHRYPDVPAKFCSDIYPPTDSVSVVKEYLQGEDHVFTDTLMEFHHLHDTLILTKYITKTIKTTDTLRDTRYVQQENKALVALRDAELKTLNSQLLSITDSRNNWRRYALILSGILALYALFRIAKYYLLRK
jgi:hypothetical protein